MPKQKYIIVTGCTAISEYVVEADSEKEAEEKFLGGEFESERITDYRDETIDSIELQPISDVPKKSFIRKLFNK